MTVLQAIAPTELMTRQSTYDLSEILFPRRSGGKMGVVDQELWAILGDPE